MDKPKSLALRDMKAKLASGASVLEVGFGDGSFLESLCRAGYAVTGTEVSKGMVSLVGKGLPQANVIATGDPAVASGNFDAACCFEVLEHVPDPAAVARRIPGKTLFASVPNPRRWYPSLTGKFEYWDYPPNHLWRFCACEPTGRECHDAGCLVAKSCVVEGSPKAMSLRWVLAEAGYTKVRIDGTVLQGDDLLRVIPIRKLSADYDDMRPQARKFGIMSLARRMSAPVTFPLAVLLSIAGFKGVSYYVHAVRE